MGTRRGLAAVGLAAVAVSLVLGGASASGQSPDQTTAGTSPPASATNSTLPVSNDRMQVIPQVPYYPGGPTFDAYLPRDGKAAHPALIMVHGGGWEGGDMLEWAPF